MKRLFSTNQALYASISDYKPNTNFKTDNWKFNYASDIEGNLKDILLRYMQEGILYTTELFSEHTTRNSTYVERLNINIFDNNIDISDTNGDGLDVYVNILTEAIHKHVSSLKDYLETEGYEPIKNIHIVLFVTHNSIEDI
jgi:hypothetical protein